MGRRGSEGPAGVDSMGRPASDGIVGAQRVGVNRRRDKWKKKSGGALSAPGRWDAPHLNPWVCHCLSLSSFLLVSVILSVCLFSYPIVFASLSVSVQCPCQSNTNLFNVCYRSFIFLAHMCPMEDEMIDDPWNIAGGPIEMVRCRNGDMPGDSDPTDPHINRFINP